MATLLQPQIDNLSVDAYLHLQTKRAGKVMGESVVPDFMGDIIVKGWEWGLSASSALGAQVERRSYTLLTIRKHIDRATTGLMAALATNDEVKEAKLCLRRAGASGAYMTIKLAKARVVSLKHETDASGHPHETIAIAFAKIDVEYRQQQATGLAGASFNFSDEIYTG